MTRGPGEIELIDLINLLEGPIARSTCLRPNSPTPD